MRDIVALAVAIVVVPGVAGLLRSPVRAVAGSDVAAFYCGAFVAARGADPYRLEPLKTCQVEQVLTPGGVTYAAAGIDPAPFPPYFFAVLAPLTLLPYAVVAVLWALAILAAACATVWLLTAVTRLHWWMIAPAVMLAVFEANFSVGQLPPFVICALAAAGYLLQRGRSAPAALVAFTCMLEPHVGLPVAAALFVWRPATRVPIAFAALAALCLSFAVPGAARLWVEYVRDVLPVHAVAEAPVWIQMSATWLLRFFGVDERLAAQIGMLQYLVVCTASVVAVGPLARRVRSPAVIVFFPAAAAVTGGTFIHYGQTTIALLAALLLAARTRSATWRLVLWVAIVLVSISLSGRGLGHDVPLVLCLLTTAVIGAGVTRRPARLLALCGAAAVTVTLVVSIAHLPAFGPSRPATAAEFTARGYDADLASTVMGYEWRRTPAVVTLSWRRLAEKIPVWLGLLAVLTAGLRLAATRDPDRVVRVARSA